MEYQAIFKCRLCGEEFTNAFTTNKDIVLNNMCSLICGVPCKQGVGIPVEKNDIHFCSDGSHGLADFQGFKAIKEDF